MMFPYPECFHPLPLHLVNSYPSSSSQLKGHFPKVVSPKSPFKARSAVKHSSENYFFLSRNLSQFVVTTFICVNARGMNE